MHFYVLRFGTKYYSSMARSLGCDKITLVSSLRTAKWLNEDEASRIQDVIGGEILLAEITTEGIE